MRSSRPIAALEMRQDLKHWPEALALAQRLAPDRVSVLSKEHAAMLEMVGEYEEARSHYQQVRSRLCLLAGMVEPELMPSSYEMCSLLLTSLVSVALAQDECNTGICCSLLQALDALKASGSDTQLQQACMAGMARILLHLGDLRGGKTLAQQLNNGSLWKECAGILEQMHQHQDAAEMYEAAGMSEKAAAIFIAARNWAAAAPLMARVTSAKLQLQYAKAKESDGSYAEAVAAYEAAGAFAKHMLVLMQF